MLNLKKMLSTLLSVTMVANMTLAIPAFADENTAETYTYEDYMVTYDVTNSWGDTEMVSITLSNTGDETIENWMLYFNPNGEITGLFDAQQATTSYGTTYYRNSGYNADVAPNASVTFSYTVDNCEEIPSDFTLCQTRADKTEGYGVSLQVNQTWGDNNEYFNGEIILQNTTDEPIEAWELMVDTNFTITEITNSWAATVTELEPYNYLLKGTYTGTVAANSNVSLGFIGVRDGEAEIIDYSLTESVVDEDAVYVAATIDDDINWSELPDSDGDGLPDEFEEEYDCDLLNPDSDGDGLPDGYEILNVGSDPANAHSLDTILSDGEYDNDQDGLSNYEEYMLGTDPLVVDSDHDGLSDGDEENVYGTESLNPDTDGDGLSDGDEIALGLNPLVSDTDSDGVLDNEEMFDQSKTFDADEYDSVVQQIDVAFEGTGYIDSTTSVKSVMGVDWMCSNVVGLIGDPYDISSDSTITEGTLTFHVAVDALGESSFDNLIVLWYNEAEQRFEELETVSDAEASTLTAIVTHFSKYLIVDCNRWYSAWNANYYPSSNIDLHTAITIDCSSSMNSNDPNRCRVDAAKGFVNVMRDNDMASVTLFASRVSTQSLGTLTKDKNLLKETIDNVTSLGVTNYEEALQYSINSLDVNNNTSSENIIIFLSDGYPTDDSGYAIDPSDFDYSIVDTAADAGIKIYTIGLTDNVCETILEEMADRTGGEYFYANTAEELVPYFLNINVTEKYDITTDTDVDGIPDLFETYGMPIANGQVIFSDVESKDKDGDGIAESDPIDSDGDGLKDSEEVSVMYVNDDTDSKLAAEYVSEYYPDIEVNACGGIYFKMTSDPEDTDTDDDGILDVDEVKVVGEDGIAARYGVQDTTYYTYTVDEHYYDYETDQPKINPLHKDTIETLYPELDITNGTNHPDNATYLNISGNNIIIETNVRFTGFYSELASEFFSNVSDAETRTVSEVLKDGIEEIWHSNNEENNKYIGTIFDFYPGIEFELSTKVNVITDPLRKHIEINVENTNGTSGHSNTTVWRTNNSRLITMRVKGRNINTVGFVMSHEFGHAIGLKDAYGANNNKNYAPISSSEIYYDGSFNRYEAGEIMYHNGRVLANDIEMVIYAYSENQYQVFVPYYAGNTLNISKAIKERQIFVKSNVLYEWNGSTMVTPSPSV